MESSNKREFKYIFTLTSFKQSRTDHSQGAAKFYKQYAHLVD